MLDGGSDWFGSETTILEQILMRNQWIWQWNLTARLNFNESTEIKILNPTKNHVFESLTLTQFNKPVAKTKFWCRYRIDLVELVLMTSLSTPNSSISISNRPFTNFDLPPSLSNFNRLAPDRFKIDQNTAVLWSYLIPTRNLHFPDSFDNLFIFENQRDWCSMSVCEPNPFSTSWLK